MITKTQILNVYALTVAFLEAGRTHGTWAVTRDSRDVDPEDERACRFCLVGAMERAVFELSGSEDRRLLEEVAQKQLALVLGLDDRYGHYGLSSWYESGHRWEDDPPTLGEVRRAISDAAHQLDSK